MHRYIVYARECVCNYSGFSKRIPRLEHPRVGYICDQTETQEGYTAG